MTPTEDTRPVHQRVYKPGREPGGYLRWLDNERNRLALLLVGALPGHPAPVALQTFNRCVVCGKPRPRKAKRFCSPRCAGPARGRERAQRPRPIPTPEQINAEMVAAFEAATRSVTRSGGGDR